MVKYFDFQPAFHRDQVTACMDKLFNYKNKAFSAHWKRQEGFSMIELMVVLGVLVILSIVALFSISAKQKYPPDDQSYLLFDLLQEARMKSITQRTIFRFEIDNTNKKIWLVNEKDPALDTDDEVVKTSSFAKGVSIGVMPANVNTLPTGSSPIPVIPFSTSKFLLTQNNQTITLRFDGKGQVLDKGSNSKGSGAIVTGATIFVSETLDAASNAKIIRAVTVNGISGNSSILKCQLNNQQQCGTWIR